MANKTKDTLTAKVVDFSNVKEGGGSFNKRRVRSGDYLAKVVKVQDAESSKDNAFQYLFTIQLMKYSQNKYPYYCKLQENQLWKLRNLLIAAGQNVPKKRMKLDPSKVVGKLIGVTMDDTEYEGKLQSEIVAVFPASELSEADASTDDDQDDDASDDGDDEDQWNTGPSDDADDDEDEADEADADEDEDEDSSDEFDAMDRTQLKAYLKGKDDSFQAKKSQTDDDLRELARAAAGDDAEEDDEEEPEPEPVKPAKKKAKAKKKAAADEDEFEELDLEDL